MEKEVQNAIENLKKYINEDTFYTRKTKIESDFDKFCYNHCKDIDILIKYVKGRKFYE